jgi:hypothetical protein
MYDTSIGYPPGLTRERFISFVRNTINCGILQKHYSPRKRQNSTIHQTFGHSVSSRSKTEIPRNSVIHYSPKSREHYSPTARLYVNYVYLSFLNRNTIWERNRERDKIPIRFDTKRYERN